MRLGSWIGDGGRSERAEHMTILITGGTGYIGSHMVHALVDAGERVVVLDNLMTGFDWAVVPGASLVVGDSGDQSRVAALIAEHQVDSIIHFAAPIVVPRLGSRSPRLLPQQYGELLRTD